MERSVDVMAQDRKYRECMAEIMGILKKHDMAGAITIVTKERCMFKYWFPKWTVIELMPGLQGDAGIRLRSERKDFASGEDQRRANELSAHVIMQMGDCAKNTILMVAALADAMRKKWDMKHQGGKDYDPELEH